MSILPSQSGPLYIHLPQFCHDFKRESLTPNLILFYVLAPLNIASSHVGAVKTYMASPVKVATNIYVIFALQNQRWNLPLLIFSSSTYPSLTLPEHLPSSLDLNHIFFPGWLSNGDRPMYGSSYPYHDLIFSSRIWESVSSDCDLHFCICICIFSLVLIHTWRARLVWNVSSKSDHVMMPGSESSV